MLILVLLGMYFDAVVVFYHQQDTFIQLAKAKLTYIVQSNDLIYVVILL